MDTLHRVNNDSVAFHCPGCKYAHMVRVAGSPATGPVWGFNGDFVAPTFTPSIRVQGDVHCHTYVTHGSIHFLADCTHDLAGCTVPIPAWAGWDQHD